LQHTRPAVRPRSGLDGIEERIDKLTIEQIDRAGQDLDNAWAGWTPRQSTLRQLLADRRKQLTAAAGDE